MQPAGREQARSYKQLGFRKLMRVVRQWTTLPPCPCAEVGRVRCSPLPLWSETGRLQAPGGSLRTGEPERSEGQGRGRGGKLAASLSPFSPTPLPRGERGSTAACALHTACGPRARSLRQAAGIRGTDRGSQVFRFVRLLSGPTPIQRVSQQRRPPAPTAEDRR